MNEYDGLGTYRTHLSNLDLENRNVLNTKKLIVVPELVYITVFIFFPWWKIFCLSQFVEFVVFGVLLLDLDQPRCPRVYC